MERKGGIVPKGDYIPLHITNKVATIMLNSYNLVTDMNVIDGTVNSVLRYGVIVLLNGTKSIESPKEFSEYQDARKFLMDKKEMYNKLGIYTVIIDGVLSKDVKNESFDNNRNNTSSGKSAEDLIDFLGME